MNSVFVAYVTETINVTSTSSYNFNMVVSINHQICVCYKLKVSF